MAHFLSVWDQKLAKVQFHRHTSALSAGVRIGQFLQFAGEVAGSIVWYRSRKNPLNVPYLNRWQDFNEWWTFGRCDRSIRQLFCS
jgi:hypothetical protein